MSWIAALDNSHYMDCVRVPSSSSSAASWHTDLSLSEAAFALEMEETEQDLRRTSCLTLLIESMEAFEKGELFEKVDFNNKPAEYH
eukprot:1762903-Rhodomonas_salina.1